MDSKVVNHVGIYEPKVAEGFSEFQWRFCWTMFSGAQFTNDPSIVIQIRWKWLKCNSPVWYYTSTIVCTPHYSTTVMPCAKFHSDHFNTITMRADFPSNLNDNGKSVVKWAPGQQMWRGISEIQRKTRSSTPSLPWWRHQMETFSALLAICAGEFFLWSAPE